MLTCTLGFSLPLQAAHQNSTLAVEESQKAAAEAVAAAEEALQAKVQEVIHVLSRRVQRRRGVSPTYDLLFSFPCTLCVCSS